MSRLILVRTYKLNCKMDDYFEREANGTRDKILCSAAKLIGAKGYAKVSVRDIAEDAGVSLGQITYHFKSKDALFIEIVERLTRSFFEDFKKMPKGKNSGREKAAVALRHSKKTLLKSTQERKMLMDFSNMAMWSREYADEFRRLFEEMELALKSDFPSSGDGTSDSEIVRITSTVTIGVSMFHIITGDKQVLDIFDKVADIFEKNAQ